MSHSMRALALAVGVSFVALTGFAQAQAPNPANPPAAAAPAKPDAPRGPWAKMSPEDRAAFFDARIAGLKAGLKLTPDQDKLWPNVETALRDGGKSMATMYEKYGKEARPKDPIEAMRRMSEASILRGETMKKLADAAAPLYGTLSEDQKRRLPHLMRGLGGGMGRHHMGGHFGGGRFGDGPGFDGPRGPRGEGGRGPGMMGDGPDGERGGRHWWNR